MRTILVVDDEQAITELICDALADAGYETRVAHDGASALLDILHQAPDLVILDVAMPVMTGEELMRELSGRGFNHLPIIVMTAGLNSDRLATLGACAVVPKPFDLVRLLDTIGTCLRPTIRAR